MFVVFISAIQIQKAQQVNAGPLFKLGNCFSLVAKLASKLTGR